MKTLSITNRHWISATFAVPVARACSERERKIMKTKLTLNLLAVAAAASLGLTTATAQPVDSVNALKNRAIAASPRALEAFPWLARTGSPRSEACCVKNEFTEGLKNSAYAASPRFLEMFPELTRRNARTAEFNIAPLVNSAFTSSPRVREEFPELSRGVVPEKGSARGGASKLMERGK